MAAVFTFYAPCASPAQDREPPARQSALDRAVESIDAVDSPNESSTAATRSDAVATDSLPKEELPANAIQSFIQSWRLFHNSYLVGWLVGLVLSLVGVVVVARDQVFIGAAVSQASTLGIALALWTGGVFPAHLADGCLEHSASWLCCDSFQIIMAVAFSILAAVATSRALRAKRESHEAIAGWIFLSSASLSVLVLAHSPHGLEEINHIHSSSIIGATAADAAAFAVLLAVTLSLLAIFGRRLLLFIMDPSMAAAVGMNVGRWALLESLWLGLVVGLSIRATGMLFTFGSLVLPALVAKNLCREVKAMFFAAPAVALATNTIGFVLANHYDFPPAQMNVALNGLLLLLAWIYSAVRASSA
jgi:zinc transport system permease protein